MSKTKLLFMLVPLVIDLCRTANIRVFVQFWYIGQFGLSALRPYVLNDLILISCRYFWTQPN